MLVIGISGKKQSGKDTVALILQQLYPELKFKRLAFADVLKQEVSDACKIPLRVIEENKEAFRPMLQWWGTDFRRKLIDENYWVDLVWRKIKLMHPNDCDVVVIPDVRFKNEADFISEIGGSLIRVERCESSDAHISETELDSYQFVYTIKNDGTKEQLKERVKQLNLI